MVKSIVEPDSHSEQHKKQYNYEENYIIYYDNYILG